MTSSAPANDPMIQEWWVQRWIDLLNSYRFKKRLERGRIYAREGHILSLEFRGAKVHARVQGTAPEPYKLTIAIDQFSNKDWDFVIDTMAQKAVYSAKLLAGEMPESIEEVFTANGLSLFPFTLGDVHSRCSCPDPKNPCKHIAAVYYQLGDFFREDPFVLFQLRGRTRAQILEALRQKRSGSVGESPGEVAEAGEAGAISPPHQPAKAPSAASSSGQNISLQPETFWHYREPLDSSLVVITPATGQTPLDILGKLPLAPNDAQTIRQYLDSVYQAAGQQAMITALSRNG
ncbi:MAG: SWIM zinc finger family protein [Synechococcales bacterium]|nr:SWIM zinc finger family protein [Synechococcales bacterium]